MLSRLKVAQQGMILVLVPVFVELLFVIVFGLLVLSGADRLREIEYSRAALLEVQRMYTLLNEAGLIIRSTEWSHKKQSEEVEKLLRKVRGVYKLEPTAAALHPELIELTSEAERIRDYIRATLEIAEKDLRLAKTEDKFFDFANKKQQLLSMTLDSQDINKRFLELQTRLMDEEPLQLNQLRTSLINYLLIGMLVSAGISVLLVIFFSKTIIERLNAVASKAALIAAEKPLPPADIRADEIGELDQIIHVAAVSLEDARLKNSAFLTSTNHVICALDSKLKISTVGQSCQKAWHFSADELIGKSILTMIVPSQIESVRSQFEKIASESEDGTIETVLRCGDMLPRTVIWTVNWRQNKFYCVVKDVTELRAVEQLRQHFFSMANHDMRAPLTAIGMNVHLVHSGTKGDIPEEAKRELQTIETNLEHLGNLINGVLELEKLEAIKSATTPSAVNAEDVCESAKETLAGQAKARGIRFLGPRGSALMLGDESQLEKAITNLLAGILNLSENGSEISIRIRELEQTCCVEVNQAQIHLSADEALVLFDKLRHVKTETGDRNSGLNFAIVKAIAEKNYGSVGVETSAQIGAKFWIEIPLFKEDLV